MMSTLLLSVRATRRRRDKTNTSLLSAGGQQSCQDDAICIKKKVCYLSSRCHIGSICTE